MGIKHVKVIKTKIPLSDYTRLFDEWAKDSNNIYNLREKEKSKFLGFLKSIFCMIMLHSYVI